MTRFFQWWAVDDPGCDHERVAARWHHLVRVWVRARRISRCLHSRERVPPLDPYPDEAVVVVESSDAQRTVPRCVVYLFVLLNEDEHRRRRRRQPVRCNDEWLCESRRLLLSAKI